MIDLKYVTTKREPFFELAKELIQPDSNVLDIGAGNGYFAEYCNRSDFYLFDGNKENVNKLIEKHPNTFYGRLPKLPFKDEFFDVIHCSHVIEHLTPQEVYDTLKEMDRCLTKNGYIVISAPLLWEKFYSDLTHKRPYNPEIFGAYMCNYKSKILTMNKISCSYNLIKLQYRYLFSSIDNSLVNTKNNLFTRAILKLINTLKNMGLKSFQKTGYTIVLKKE